MPTAPRPANEQGRLAALAAYDVLETSGDDVLQSVAARAARETGTSIGLVSFISSDRQWIKASVGLDMDGVDRDSAFCAWAVYSADVVWIEDALLDPRFSDNPLVRGEPHIRHYAGAPIITPHGYVLGTVCVIDDKPRRYDPAVAPVLQRLAGEIAETLRRRKAAAEASGPAREHAA